MSQASFAYENHISGIHDILSGNTTKWYDVTATPLWSMIATASGLDTGAALAAAKTKTATADLTYYKENTLYLTVTSLIAANAMTTGFEYTVYSRATSTYPWATILSNSAIGTGNYAIKLVGSGGSNSGISHLGKIKIELVNQSNSGTALSTAYILSRTP